MHIIPGLGLAALGAALFTLAFPPYDLWPLAFVWMVPVMVSVHRLMPERLSGLAMGIGVGGFFWGYFGGMFEGILYMQYLPLFIGLAAALVGSREKAFHTRTGYRWFILQGALLWVGIEMIRGFIPVAGTWGFAAYSLYRQPWLIQPVSIFSIYGMSLVIMLVNYALALVVLAEIDRRSKPGKTDFKINPFSARRRLKIVLAVMLAWAGLSLALYDLPGPELKVAAVQPGFVISKESASPLARTGEEGLPAIAELTARASEQGARFIVWPEGFLSYDPQETETEFFRELARRNRAYLAIGYVVQTEKGLRNEATVLSPNGDFLGIYGKDHPVTFAGETSITRGEYPVYDTSIGSIGTIICYDLDFTGTARRVAGNGAEIIGVPSWDWPAIAHKHYSHVVFRAVENRVAMIKADTAYDSAIIDPYGNIVKKHVSTNPEQAVLAAALAPGTPHAPAVMLGDWVGWLSLAGMAFFAGLDIFGSQGSLQKNRRQGDDQKMEHQEPRRRA